MENKPLNILFIMSDQHSAAALGALGNSVVQTPNLDRIARDGVTFRNCYCNSPICGPSRWSLMTGQFVHNHKGWDNGSTLSSEEPTFAHPLTQSGYETAICARMHFQGPDQHHGYELRLATEHNNPIIYGSLGLGDGLTENPACEGIRDCEIPKDYPARKSPRLLHDDYVLEKCREYLRGKSWAARPFMLTASFLAPHPSVKRREAYRDLYNMYLEMDLGEKEITEEQFNQLHPHSKRLTARGKPACKLESKTEKHRMLAEYYSRVTYFDRQIGQLLDTLEKENLADNTVIVYTSDHGDDMGKLGYWGKTSFYEHVVKVPLIISIPGKTRNVIRDENVSLVDLFPTLTEIAGCPPVTYPLDGNSLMPLVRGKSSGWNNIAFSEYYGHYAKNAMFMLKKDNLKLNFYVNEKPELFDLSTDPLEKTNLAETPGWQSTLSELESELRKICVPEACQEEFLLSHAKRSLITGATMTSEITKQRIRDYIHEYRSKWNEPTWDNNEEQQIHEYHLK